MPTQIPALKPEAFQLPDNIIYLDGNSLGPLPVTAEESLRRVVCDEWGQQLIRAWNQAGWFQKPGQLGDKIAPLIGADPGTVQIGDTLSIRVYQALAAALALRPERRIVLSDTGNFPSDLYMIQALLDTLGQGHELRLVAPEDVAGAIDTQVATLVLTHVDFTSGRMHDMAGLSHVARQAGVITLWDLAHSAGAVPVDLKACDADYAVGCTYKYLNGGPGAPAFLYAKPTLIDQSSVVLPGWMGHADPFAMAQTYRPADGRERFRVGTPPVLQMAALEAALDVWAGVDMGAIRASSIELSETFIAAVEARCPTLILASPRDPDARGSQVSFRHVSAYAIMQALIARGVIGDMRPPDLIRFGFAPLYNDGAQVRAAADALAEVMASKAYEAPEYQVRSAVT